MLRWPVLPGILYSFLVLFFSSPIGRWEVFLIISFGIMTISLSFSFCLSPFLQALSFSHLLIPPLSSPLSLTYLSLTTSFFSLLSLSPLSLPSSLRFERLFCKCCSFKLEPVTFSSFSVGWFIQLRDGFPVNFRTYINLNFILCFKPQEFYFA